MCKKSHAHLKNACNTCVKFQIESLKTPRGVDYTNLLPLQPNLKTVYVKNIVILSKISVSPAKRHMYIFNMLITSVQSFKLIA